MSQIGPDGKIVCGKRVFSHWEAWRVKTDAKLERMREERQTQLGFAKMFAGRISTDHGTTWKLVAICENCKKAVEPPTRLKAEGSAASMNCDLCGAYNEEFKGRL